MKDSTQRSDLSGRSSGTGGDAYFNDTLTFGIAKTIMVLLVLAFGAFYALPNLYPDVPVVQVSGLRAGQDVSSDTMQKIEATLKQAQINVADVQLEEGKGVLIFEDTEEQLRARDLLAEQLSNEVLVGLNLMPTTPDWLARFGGKPMALGLDLQGGVHFLLEVDLESAIKNRVDSYREEAREAFRQERLFYKSQTSGFDEESQIWSVQFTFTDEATLNQAQEWADSNLQDLDISTEQSGDGEYQLIMRLRESQVQKIGNDALTQNLTTLRNRVNELGVAEPLVQRQGASRIVVELPGVQDTTQASRVLGKTANLEFRLVNMDASPISRVDIDSERFDFRSQENRSTVLYRRVITTGDQVLDAHSGIDEQGLPQVSIVLDSQGGKRMMNATSGNIGNDMAVLFIEQKSEMVPQPDGTVKRVSSSDSKVINQATIRDVLGNRFVITGLDSRAEAAELALLLRSGALAAPMFLVEESTIGPSLGAENISAGINSALIGVAAVMVFMLAVYKVFGLVANIALVLNMLLLVAALSLFSATLTLPGMAGIVLTIGMAVDANVLIFARIREELHLGLTPVDAIRAGYERAFITIFDANITTFAVALILFFIGSGPIKGFAVTLSIGILTSMFTAVVVSKMLITWIYGRKPIQNIMI